MEQVLFTDTTLSDCRPEVGIRPSPSGLADYSRLLWQHSIPLLSLNQQDGAPGLTTKCQPFLSFPLLGEHLSNLRKFFACGGNQSYSATVRKTVFGPTRRKVNNYGLRHQGIDDRSYEGVGRAAVL